MEEDNFTFIPENHSSNLVTYEIPPGVYEVSDINNDENNFAKANLSFDIITIKLKLKTNHNLELI